VALRQSEALCENLKSDLREIQSKHDEAQSNLHHVSMQVMVLTSALEAKTIDFDLRTQEVQQQVLQKIGQAFHVQKLCYNEMAKLKHDKDEAVEKMLAYRLELAQLREEGLYMTEEVRNKLGLHTAVSQTEIEELRNDINTLTKEKLELQESLAESKIRYEEMLSLNSQQTEGRQPIEMADVDPNASELSEEAQTIEEEREEVTKYVKQKMFERALSQAQREAEQVGGTVEPEEFRHQWEANEGLMIDLQDSVAEQLSGDLGCLARQRFENPEGQAEFESQAALYVRWKARFALEQSIRKECEVEIEALNMRYNSKEYTNGRATYEALQNMACTRDFRGLLQYNFVGVTGQDAFGVPVVVFAAANVPKEKFSLDKYMQFVVYMLDDIVDNPYHLVYINSSNGDCSPCEVDNDWLERGMDILPSKYKRNLQNLFVLHPTFWFKMSSFPFDSKTQQKIKYVDTIDDLFKHLGRRGTILPGYAYDAEGSLHHSRQLLVRAKQQSWDRTMLELEEAAKLRLLERDRNTLDFLGSEKQRFLREELYADAELVKDEMEALRSEILSLETEMELSQ